MSKKKAATATKPPTVITLTLPETTALPRVGQLVMQRGTLATVSQFTYSSINDLTLAIQQAATSLHTLEQAPPEMAPADVATPAAAVSSESPDEGDDEIEGTDNVPPDSPAVTAESVVPSVVPMPRLAVTPANSGQLSLL